MLEGACATAWDRMSVLCPYGCTVCSPCRTGSEATPLCCVRPLLCIVGPVSVHQLFGPILSGNGQAVDLARCLGPAPARAVSASIEGSASTVPCGLWRVVDLEPRFISCDTGETCSGDPVIQWAGPLRHPFGILFGLAHARSHLPTRALHWRQLA